MLAIRNIKGRGCLCLAFFQLAILWPSPVYNSPWPCPWDSFIASWEFPRDPSPGCGDCICVYMYMVTIAIWSDRVCSQTTVNRGEKLPAWLLLRHSTLNAFDLSLLYFFPSKAHTACKERVAIWVLWGCGRGFCWVASSNTWNYIIKQSISGGVLPGLLAPTEALMILMDWCIKINLYNSSGRWANIGTPWSVFRG